MRSSEQDILQNAAWLVLLIALLTWLFYSFCSAISDYMVWHEVIGR